MIDLDEHVRNLVDYLVAVKPSLLPEEIRPDASITRNLEFDSLDVIELAARIRDTYPDCDLSAWLANAIPDEMDSVASIAKLLARSAVERKDAE